MSTRYEGTHAMNVRFTVLNAGEDIGDDVVGPGQVALCLNYDEVFYIEGTVSEVKELLQDAITTLENEEYERLRRTDSNDLTGDEA